ncbi:hypothetical protein KKG51_02145 [Patescibacteria group bacterium]|nr:hypothetical protein [Patescibacteria group bacterium]
MLNKRLCNQTLWVLVVILLVAIFVASWYALNALKQRRDTQRIVHLGNIVMAVERYNATKAGLPESQCVTESSTLGAMFEADNFPKDPDGLTAVAGCEGYYYYQKLTRGYTLIGKMELRHNGNHGSQEEQALADNVWEGFTVPDLINRLKASPCDGSERHCHKIAVVAK